MTRPSIPALTLKPSKLLAAWLIMIHSGAVICVAYLPFPLPLKLLLASICASGFIISWRRQITGNGRQIICKIKFLANGDWELQDKQGRLHRCQLLAHSVVTRFVMLLHFATPTARRRIALVLPCDALDQAEFRRLQIHILTQ
jgi:hypothetical protein